MVAPITSTPRQSKATHDDQRLSRNGQWRSFQRVPNLLQYVPNGLYYGRARKAGKLIRRSLHTTTFSVANLRLLDYLKEHRADPEPKAEKLPALTVAQARELYVRWLESDLSLKPRSREYRQLCLTKIEASWPQLASESVLHIGPQRCRDWASGLQLSSHYFNNVIGTLRQIFDFAIREHRRTGRTLFENPVNGISRARVRPKHLVLPEPQQFKDLIQQVRRGSSGWGHRAADLIEFLAFSGLRAFSEANWVTWSDVDWNHNEIVVRGSPETGTKNREVRRVPILPDMAQLLRRLAEGAGTTAPTDRILALRECQGALERPCAKLGLRRITHHDLRHLFATRCIESGVDIPTVARWMGHRDGGALAMKTYGHLPNEHSQFMAQKVRF